MSRQKRILFLTPYPRDSAGSQRFRFEQYFSVLSEAGYAYDVQSFIDESTWKILYSNGHLFQKFFGIISGYIRRTSVLFKAKKYDFVFVHREATPLGMPFVEWFMTKVIGKSIIYDFDDAIWLQNTSTENRMIAWLKNPLKVGKIIKWSYKISVGNQFLADFALHYSSSVHLNPTTIDTVNRHIPSSSSKKVSTIGWTGTHSTLKYLEPLREVFEDLLKVCEFEFVLISDKAPKIQFPNQKFIPWNKETEIEDLNQIEIGVMPLENDKWAKGKCGFKALQFMALEKPVLVSPVGVNMEIVEPDVHGLHCTTRKEWFDNLKLLIDNKELGTKMGKQGRKKVEAQYSVISNQQNFINLFQ